MLAISTWASGADSTLGLFLQGGIGEQDKRLRCWINMTEVHKLGDKDLLFG